MSNTYQTSVVREFGSMNFEERPLPEVGPREALVKLIATGVCHSDVHTVDGDWPEQPQLPSVPGHEGVGEVVAVGSAVDDVQLGDLLGNAWNVSACGDCEYCNDGWETVCEEQVISGYGADGSFAEYMVVDTKYSARIPKDADALEVAPLLCAGVTVYKGIKQAFAAQGSWMAIVGVGGLGHLAVQYAKAMGFRVIAVDVNDEALDLARKHGAEATVNSSSADAADRVRGLTGTGVHTTLVAATHPSAYDFAIKTARRRGTIICLGVPPEAVPVHMADMAGRALTLRGSTVGTRQDIEEAIDFYTRGLVKPTVHPRRFADLNDIIGELRVGNMRGRAVVDFAL